jgi:hypothetical protein
VIVLQSCANSTALRCLQKGIRDKTGTKCDKQPQLREECKGGKAGFEHASNDGTCVQIVLKNGKELLLARVTRKTQ